jgi:hypothetical protein
MRDSGLSSWPCIFAPESSSRLGRWRDRPGDFSITLGPPDGRARGSPPHDFQSPRRLAWFGDRGIRLLTVARAAGITIFVNRETGGRSFCALQVQSTTTRGLRSTVQTSMDTYVVGKWRNLWKTGRQYFREQSLPRRSPRVEAFARGRAICRARRRSL